jgi:phage terminase large subunit GpA-like protein
MNLQTQSDNQKILAIWRDACEIAVPKGGLTVSQWADANRVLSSESSAEPGRWSTERNPCMREPMECYNDPRVHTIVLMTSSQVGKSETLNNILGYSIHINPGPVMMIQPTLDRMKDYSKKRIAPMLRDTPALAHVMISNGERDGDDTIFSKAFVGGHLSMVGANSSSALASQPIRDILADEVDRYPRDVDDEGDPLSLAVVRTTTFSNRKIVVTSTPTVKNESRIEEEFANSDQRYFMVPCPHCDTYQRLVWKDEQGNHRLQWEVSEQNPEMVVQVYYVCVNGCMIENHHKSEMFARGEWEATAPFNGTAGFHLSAIYSVWLSWKELAEKFIKAKKTVETLKVFVNTMLGETWDREREPADIVGLEDRCEEYKAEVPLGGLIITSGVDVQPDRLECEIVAWGHGEESWSIEYHTLYGDTSQQDVWEQLKEKLFRDFTCEREKSDGTPLTRRIMAIGIDSGGHNTQDVYKFVRANAGRRVFALKGASTGAKSIIARPSNVAPGVWLHLVGTTLAKDQVFAHLKQTKVGEGYCHFPNAYKDNQEYFRQLTAEKRVRKLKKFDKDDPHGYSQWMYKKIRRRNEALDCRVYAYAMLRKLEVSFENLQKEENLTCERQKSILPNDVVAQRQTTKYGARRGTGGLKGGVHGWRR